MPSDRRLVIFLALAALAILGALALRPPAPASTAAAPTAHQSTFQAVCATCHGPRGAGNRDLGAPPITNLPEWFLTEQLHKFRTGLRGIDPRDIRGQQMRAAVQPLSDKAIAEALAELATFPVVAPTPTLTGNLEAGAESYLVLCMECHRYNGQGELSFKSSPLAALPGWYLSAQLNKFLDGTRGSHPDDEFGSKMQEMARRPANKEDITNILSFIGTLHEKYPFDKAADTARRE